MSQLLPSNPPASGPAPAGETRRALLVLADVSGYTRFISANRTALEHSQLLINELIEAILREVEIPLQVSKLEGDAVFLYAAPGEGEEWQETMHRISERLVRLFAVFSRRLEELSRTITCNCEICSNVEKLRLKIVVHSGAVLFTRVGQFDELLGLDVIIAHRLLKNSVPAEEYLLLSEAAWTALQLPNSAEFAPGREQYDAIGEVETYVWYPNPAPLPAAPAGWPDAEQQIRQLSRRSFAWAGVTIVSTFLGWKWLTTRRKENDVPWPLRRTLELNEQLGRDYFNPRRLSPTFPRSLAAEPRPNGEEGLSEEFDPAEWRLRVYGLADPAAARLGKLEELDTGESTRVLTLADIRTLPKVEMVTELRCVEGWSQVVHWAGARFLDFAAKLPPASLSEAPPDPVRRPDELVPYVGLETPDNGYYVGLDMASALHPQTLLCYEMNGEPLAPEHGAPLRLVIPVKYGIKNLKRIGTIRYAEQRPRDYWYERGYDYYVGH